MKKFFKFTLKFFKEYKEAFLKSLFYVLLLTGFNVLLPVSLRFFIKKAEQKQTFSFLYLGILGYAGYLLIINLTDILWSMSLNKLGGKIMQNIREKLLNAISKADYQELLNVGKDKLKNILFMDTLNVFRSIAHVSIQIISNIILLIVFLIVSSYFNVKLTIILFIAAVIGFLISFLSRKQITNSSRQVNQKMKSDNQTLNEYIDALELVKTNNVDRYFLHKNKKSLWNFINTSTNVDKKQIFLKNLMIHFHQLVSIGLAAFLSMTTKDNSAGNLVFYLFVSDMVLKNSEEIENSMYTLMKMMPSFEHIDSIINMKKCGGSSSIGNINSIELRNVSFSYKSSNDKIVLNHVNAYFTSGDVVKITGANGGGKSTFVKIIAGLLYPNGGQVLLNGIPLEDIDINCLKKQILYVDQDEIILNDSIKKYLETLSQKIISNTELNGLMDKVKFDDNINSVTQGGHSLSGGQRKKLLLMKILLRYKDSSVIILDEIEAGLDAQTKDIILQIEHEIISQNKDCIIFKISHEDNEENFYTKIIEFNGR